MDTKFVISVLNIFIIIQCMINHVKCVQQNKTSHLFHQSTRISSENNYMKNHKLAYRSFQPVAINYRKNLYPKIEQRTDYDINSYDTEYGGVVSNFTSSIYDDNPPIYPNPEILLLKKNKELNKPPETKIQEPEIELPDDSLADSDLKEHNIIDSVTYLYGFNNCHGTRNEWMILIFIASGLSITCPVAAIVWLMWSQHAADFRRNSKLYPININLCCCLIACTLIYIQAVMGASSPAQCERIALVLHYTHISCAMWIVALAAAVTEYCVYDSVLPLKYNYLLSYGVPGVVVMFNYALSMEQYETKHYCWMSIEKGMVMGFMIPAMILIVINTGIAMFGMQGVNRKRTEMITVTIQELVKQHIANKKNDQEKVENELEDMDCPAGSSRSNVGSSGTLDRDYNYEEECYTGSSDGINEDLKEANEHLKRLHERGILNVLYNVDNLAWKLTSNTQANALKSYLNMCLVLEPFFAINWVMGVVAIENASHWSTPAIYLILVLSMHIYLAAIISTTLPIVSHKSAECCEEIIIEPPLRRSRTTDSIPLLDPSVQQPNVTTTPADTISTISI